MKALVVDDSRAIRLMLIRMLADCGFQVLEAGHGREALERLAQDVDLITVDWNMPEMNGLEFVQAVRQDPAFEATKIMMVTTETEMSQVQRALDAGAQEYVMKPFTKAVLEDKLHAMGLVA
jgi:two-component system, chemotaxis family, chemotaxis protein CheY